MEKSLKDLKKDFALFIEQIPEYIEILNRLLGKKLTFEYDDIDKVQNLYESNFKNPEKIGLYIDRLNNCFYAYMGEAFIHYNGGRWYLCISKKDKAYGTPVITEWGEDGFNHVTISPYIWKEYIVRGLMDEPISKIIWRSQIPMQP